MMTLQLTNDVVKNMKIIPKDLEQMICREVVLMIKYDSLRTHIQMLRSSIDINMFIINDDSLENIINDIRKASNCNDIITDDEIINCMVNSVDYSNSYSRWSMVGSGADISSGIYKKIEDLPYIFIDKYKDKIPWENVGSGVTFFYKYTKIEELPETFLDKYKDKIEWAFVGSGAYDGFGGYTKIEDLPYHFLDKYKDKISWVGVGSGVNNYYSYTKMEDLPRHFLDRYEDKIWQNKSGRYDKLFIY